MNGNDIIRKALRRFWDCESNEELPKSLPLVEEFCENRLAAETFADTDVLFIQHHLGPFIPRLRVMCDYGLETSRCWFVDIPYSTNKCVCEQLHKMDFPENQRARPFSDPIAPYSRRQLERAAYIVRLLANQDNKRRLLVVDDGAYFMRTLNYLLFRDRNLVMSFRERNIRIVEQTTRGHRYLRKKEGREMLKLLNMPVVSIARANAKYNLESPFIGAAVSRAMLRALKSSARLNGGLGRVLIIGFGAVGQATTQQLLAKLNPDKPIHVYDKEWGTLQKEIEKVGACALKAFPDEGPYDCVIGCTGKASFPVNKVGILANDAVLVSGSSGAIEFNREKFIDLAYKHDRDDFYIIEPEKTRNHGIHATIEMQKGDKRFSFLHAGFPINFDGRLECLPALIIQIAHGLLLAACQETLFKEPGFHKLNQGDDNWFNEQGLYWIDRYSAQAI